MSAAPTVTIGRLANLVIPGGGLILIGSETVGVVIALLFTGAANLTIAASFVFPDDFSSTWRGLGMGVAAVTYLGAQFRYAQTVRDRHDQAVRKRRGAALGAARAALNGGHLDQAWLALEPLVEQAEQDLVLAYRIAQVLTARGDRAAAAAAWRRVRRLDRHRIYRQEVNQGEHGLSAPKGGLSGMDSSGSHPD